jgi:hypothetical protein
LSFDKGLSASTGRGSISSQAKGGCCGKGRAIGNVLEPGLGGYNGSKINRAQAHHGENWNEQGELQGDGTMGLAPKPVQ